MSQDDIMNQIARLLQNKTTEPAVNLPEEVKSAPRSQKIRLLRSQLQDGKVMIAHPSVSKILKEREVKK